MDIRDLLTEDHQEALELARRIEDCDDANEAGTLFAQLHDAITRHSRGEERIVYPALEDSGDEEAAEMVREAAVEHELVDLLLARMKRMRTASDNWKARACVVRELLEHHIEEEQEEMYDKIAQVCDDDERQDMAQRFRSFKQRVRVPAAGGAGAGAASAAH